MAGKTSTTSEKNTRSSSRKNTSKESCDCAKEKRVSRQAKRSKNKPKVEKETTPSANPFGDIPMEKVNTIKGIIELPKEEEEEGQLERKRS